MKNIVITILTILVLCLGGYLIYDKIIDKDSRNKIIDKDNEAINNELNNNELESDNNLSYRDKDEYIGIAISRYATVEWYLSDKYDSDPDYLIRKIELPKILFDTENAKQINEKIYSDYKEDIDKLKYNEKNSKPFDINISYDYSINDNILSLVIEKEFRTARGSGYDIRKGYYYDIKNDRELILDEVCNMFNITLDKVKSKNSNIERIDAILANPNDYTVYYYEGIQNEVATNIKY